MSVALISPPPAYVFSRDTLKLKFQCTDLFAVEGVKAGNTLKLLGASIPVGSTIVFTYGSTTVTMTSAEVPDDSGYQFSSNATDSVLAEQLAANFVLSRDFEVVQSGVPNVISFTARKASLGFNFTTAIYSYAEVKPGVVGVVAQEKPNYAVMFRLYSENAANTGFELIYEHNAPVTYGTGGIAEVPINDRLNDYIATEIRNNLPEIPTTGHLLCKKSCRRYYFEYAESYGAPVVVRAFKKSAEFVVLQGGLSTIGQASTSIYHILNNPTGLKRFLKQGPKINATRSNQLQYLYYFNTSATLQCILKCRLRFTDGSKTLIDVATFSLLSKMKYGFNVSCDKVFIAANHPGKTLLAYDVFLSDTDGIQFTETQTYVMDYRPLQFIRYFTNWSSWGSMDSRMFYGKGNIELNIEQSEADRSNSHLQGIIHGTSLVFDIKLKSKFSVATGYMESRELLILNRDFFSSVLKYRIAGSHWLPVKVTSKTIGELQDGNYLPAQDFEYEYLFDDQAYTEGDVQEPGLTYDQLYPAYSEIFLTDRERVFLTTPNNLFITI